MPSINLFYILLTALITTLVLIPPISRLAINIGKLDQPDERKVHLNGTPRLGGIAIFLAFILPVLLFSKLDSQTRGLMAGAVIIFMTGLYDDLVGISPRKKFAGQFLAALAVVIIGDLRLTDVGDLLGTGKITLGIFSIPFTVVAIVGVTNAVNLLDGLDGLAGGVTAIAAVTFGLLALLTGNYQLLLMTTALVGALLGFLKYNTHPARIFMGDSGSLLLGYCLAVFAVMLTTSGGAIPAVTPLTILAVPIVDTIIVMVKRLRDGRSLFSPDNKHIHHRLLGIGFGHQATVVLIYILSYLLAIIAVVSYRLPGAFQTGIFFLAVLGLSSLHCFTRGQWLKKRSHLRISRPLTQTRTYRRIVHYSQSLVVVAKYLVVGVLFATFFANPPPNANMAIIANLFLILSITLVFLTQDWGNRFLLFILYFDGAFLIYLLENYGRDRVVGWLSLSLFSHVLFLSLLVVCGIKLIIRRRNGELMNSPLEYLLLFIVISVPLLPGDFIGRYHLLTVAAKSVILFTAYRMVLMRQARRNRKIIVATLAALLVISVKGFF